MAKAANKKSRRDQYAEILVGAGVRFEDCRVLAFSFEQTSGPDAFHFRLIGAAPRPRYLLFDKWIRTAQVVVPRDEGNAAYIAELAEKEGGKKATPNLS